jgi:hypothetical protein
MSAEITDFEIPYEIQPGNSGAVVLLPLSIDGDFLGSKRVIYPQTTVSVLKKLKLGGVDTHIAYGQLKDAVLSDNRSIDWFGPILLFTATALSENSALVDVSLNIISSYVYDLFKGKTEDPRVRCTFVYQGQENSKCKKVSYEGPVSGLATVKDIVQELHNG